MAHPDDDGLIRSIRSTAATTTDGGEMYQAAIEREAANGAAWAQEVQCQAEREGYRRLYVSGLKRLSGAYQVTRDAIQRQVRRVFGIAERRDDGTRTGAFQPDFWMGSTWEQIDELIQAQRVQIDRLETNATLMAYVVRDLSARCPGASTPLEACQMLGMDPEEYIAGIQL